MREVKPMNVPAHLAIIMDGNGRWAKKRSMPRFMGHAEGAKSVRVITEECARLGIKYLTLYAFSTENWKRPEKEVSFLMGLLGRYLDSETETLLKNNVRLFTIGDISKLPAKVSRKLESVKEKTSKNSGLKLVLALNYGSKNEILSAVKKIAEKAASGALKPGKITEETITQNLYTASIPDPDLMIRTSGEFRISNFLLWQLAYTELYITNVLWPDFRKKELLSAIRSYNKRDRRYGGIKSK
jgi:undecaprenyl diphosphate synthase